MPIQIRTIPSRAQLNEPARQGFATLLLSGLIGLVVTRWFLVMKKKNKAKPS